MPVNPVPKFLMVKSVVFFTFWQSVALAMLSKMGVFDPTDKYTTDEIISSVEDFLICVEMFIAAIGHHVSCDHDVGVGVGGIGSVVNHKF